MTVQTTESEKTQTEATQDKEDKNTNQEEAFKRMQEKNKKLEQENAEFKAKAEEKSEELKAQEEKERLEKENPDVRKIVQDELNAKLESEKQLNDVLKKYPYLEEHKSKITKYLADSSRKGVPVDEVVAGAVGIDVLLQAGAKIGAEALKAAKDSTRGGEGATQTFKTAEEKREQMFMDNIPDDLK